MSSPNFNEVFLYGNYEDTNYMARKLERSGFNIRVMPPITYYQSTGVDVVLSHNYNLYLGESAFKQTNKLVKLRRKSNG